MKTIIAIILLSLVLVWCKSQADRYNDIAEWCTMPWHIITQRGVFYDCETEERVMQDKFSFCSYRCETAVDDYRDVSLTNAETWLQKCLEICMQIENK